MKKVVVLGSNSFSGSDFIDLLLEKQTYRVTGISRSPEKSTMFLPYKRHKNAPFTFHQFDLNRDIAKIVGLLKREKPSYIVNFAAQSEVAPSWLHPQQWFETNVVSLAKLTNYLRNASYLEKYMHISTPEVYGTTERMVKEDAPLNPSTPYAASKVAADLFLFTLVKNFKFPLVTIRPTNFYGAHQQLFKIIPRTIISVKLKKRVELHGAGMAIKSYIHIRDVSRAQLAVLEKGKIGEIYHVSPDRGIKVAKVVRLICDKMNVSFEKATKVVPERLGQDKAYVIDSSKARRSLGWKPKVSLEQGIEGVIAWIDDNWDVIKKLPHVYVHKT